MIAITIEFTVDADKNLAKEQLMRRRRHVGLNIFLFSNWFTIKILYKNLSLERGVVTRWTHE
jgi:hypothetical protein